MINSKVCATRNKVIRSFPKLMVSKDLIVLFDQVGSGIVISRVEAPFGFGPGTYRVDFDMADFKEFEGTVELSNLT